MSKPVILQIAAALLLAMGLFVGYYVLHYQSELGDLQTSSATHLAAADRACAAGQSNPSCVLETSLVRTAAEDARFVRSQRSQYAVATLVLVVAAIAVFRLGRRRR